MKFFRSTLGPSRSSAVYHQIKAFLPALTSASFITPTKRQKPTHKVLMISREWRKANNLTIICVHFQIFVHCVGKIIWASGLFKIL